MSEFNALTIAQIIAALRAENDALRAKLKAPYCACEWDAEDCVTGLCLAHAAYFADETEEEVAPLRERLAEAERILRDAFLEHDETGVCRPCKAEEDAREFLRASSPTESVK